MQPLKTFLMATSAVVFFHGISQASDRPEDVERSYRRAMEQSEKCESILNIDPTTANVIFESLKSLGLKEENITTREKFLEKTEEFNSSLFHALSASISTVSDYLDNFTHDESLEATYNHSILYNNGHEKPPLDFVNVIKGQSGGDAFVFSNRQLYQIQRQKTCFDLRAIWNLLVFWKKTIFPLNTARSYVETNAWALKSQVEHLLKIKTNALDSFPKGLEELNPDHYEFAIADMLTQISGALPKKIYHKITSLNIRRPIQERFNVKDKSIEEKRNIFMPAYFSFIDKVRRMSGVFKILIENPNECSKNPHLKKNIESLYNDFQSFKFPFEKRSIIFNSRTLDFDQLIPTSFELKTSDLVGKANIEEVGSPEQPRSSVMLTSEKPHSQTSQSEELDSDEEDEVIYDKAYWSEQNQIHQLRKKLSSRAFQSPAPLQLSDYEQSLYGYLENSIYKYRKRKGRELIAELKGLKFKVEVSNSGKGSLHYVLPTHDNPLFGQDENYARAYFNVHLPHTDGDIVPSAYFAYFQSGFANVFGLSYERVTTKLETATEKTLS